MPYRITTRRPGEAAITTLPPVLSRRAAIAKLIETHGKLVLTHRVVGSPNFIYQFEDGTAATFREITDGDPSPIPA